MVCRQSCWDEKEKVNSLSGGGQEAQFVNKEDKRHSGQKAWWTKGTVDERHGRSKAWWMKGTVDTENNVLKSK